jgi:CelD/BcsL family acetyltransferase involved in cellulose biosynthesis
MALILVDSGGVARPSELLALTVDTHSAIDPVAGEWEELAERTGAPPWLRARWVSAWWEAFGKNELELVALRREGRLAALIPLERRGRAVSSPTNWHTPDFRLTADDDEARKALVDALYSLGRRRVSLGFIDRVDADTCRRAADAKGYRMLERTLESPPYLRTDGDSDAYEASLDRHVMSETRRRRRRLSEQGELTFDVQDGRERLEALLEEGFRVEASGWKGEAGTAILSQEQTRRFYTEIARWCAEQGWLRLAFLRLDGRPIAFQYLIEYDGVLSQLKGGFDEAYRKFAPGTLLLQDVIARAFESDARTYEFLGAMEAFKLEWATGHHDRRLLQAFAPTPAGFVDRAAFAYGRPIAKRVLSLVHR